jgi:hypothetical protein
MKKNSSLLLAFLISITSNSQIQSLKTDGGSVITKLGYGISVNEGSNLKREWITLNDPKCPVQLKNVGINTFYTDSRYGFKSVGEVSVSEPITAYELHHILYNVFGEYIKTLSNQEVLDISESKSISKLSSWYASENEVSEFLFVVTYVANVRTLTGTIWKYNSQEIKAELNKIKINYEEGFSPKQEIKP